MVGRGDEMARWPGGCKHVISVRHLVVAALCVHAFLHDLLIQSATATTYVYSGASCKFNFINTVLQQN